MNAARGEVVVYTDSDCEADEDWLYYLALALVRSGHAGMGGPNLIPDEGSWVADCVGLSPGGPTHVMIDDRTAEHVPGCNMAFYTWVLKQVNGFDSQFRKAGDDVDVIWRIQNAGQSIGFSPAAQVWHYRRNTVKAYLKQQRGYGEAEALLKYKHPDHFNTLGASHWRGKIYGGDAHRRPRRRRRHLSRHFRHRPLPNHLPPARFDAGHDDDEHRMASAAACSSRVLGLAWFPLLIVAALMFVTPIVLSFVAAWQAPMPRHRHPLSRFAHRLFAFPPADRRAAGPATASGCETKFSKTKPAATTGTRPLPIDPADQRILRYWSDYKDRLPLLEQISQEVRQAGWRMREDSGWGEWDLEIYGSRYVKVRLTTATEHHHGKGMLTRVRVELLQSRFGQVLMVGALILAGLLLLHLWPFSRPAVLIPLAWWAMYLVNRRRVTVPVLGLIDHAAEQAGYIPLPPEPAPAQPMPAVPQPGDALDEDGELSVA